jgi:hypothetical protein
MLIQKIFHVHQGLQETKERLAHVQNYRQYLDGVRKAVITEDGVAQFDCVIPDGGFRAHLVLVELPTTDENQVLFRSTAGNIELSGLIEFFPIKDNLTEVQLTVEYSLRSPVHSIFNAFTSSLERFMNRQLRRVQGILNGEYMPIPTSTSPIRNSSIAASYAQLAS